mmetsp:Transcript_56728/g.164546  ORF Transcript_56728/g.164546 Transcript_56728/m.164546 type:complete len:205 (-) Transcript_56728:889-1503(-)
MLRHGCEAAKRPRGRQRRRLKPRRRPRCRRSRVRGGGGRAAGTVATAGPTGAVAAATPVVGRKAIAAPTITALARSQRPHRRRPRRPLALALPMVASAMSHGTVASATAFAGGSATVALTSRRFALPRRRRRRPPQRPRPRQCGRRRLRHRRPCRRRFRRRLRRRRSLRRARRRVQSRRARAPAMRRRTPSTSIAHRARRTTSL